MGFLTQTASRMKILLGLICSGLKFQTHPRFFLKVKRKRKKVSKGEPP